MYSKILASSLYEEIQHFGPKIQKFYILKLEDVGFKGVYLFKKSIMYRHRRKNFDELCNVGGDHWSSYIARYHRPLGVLLMAAIMHHPKADMNQKNAVSHLYT